MMVVCADEERHFPPWSRWLERRSGLSDWSVTGKPPANSRQRRSCVQLWRQPAWSGWGRIICLCTSSCYLYEESVLLMAIHESTDGDFQECEWVTEKGLTSFSMRNRLFWKQLLKMLNADILNHYQRKEHVLKRASVGWSKFYAIHVCCSQIEWPLAFMPFKCLVYFI